MTARVVQLSVSRGGVPKLPIAEAVVTPTGLVGDTQRLRKLHGGPERAVCLFALERIAELQREGHPIEPGMTGENITTEGLDWVLVVPGARLAIGAEVVLEIASYTEPCKQIAAAFAGGTFRRMGQPQHPGWSRVYARVRAVGRVVVGDEIRIL